MAEATATDLGAIIRRWKGKRGSLIMMLHDIQDQHGYVPREVAMELGLKVGVPLARIYEVVTFYNYFKLKAPGRAVVSICTGTACHLKGANDILDAFKAELAIDAGQTTSDGNFHLQCVRCVGCCALAPVVVINARVHSKVKTAEVRGLVAQWRDQLSAQQR